MPRKICNLVGIAWFVYVAPASNFPMLIIGVRIAVTGCTPTLNFVVENLSL